MKTCVICGDALPKQKRKLCGKPECEKKHYRAYHKAYDAKQKPEYRSRLGVREREKAYRQRPDIKERAKTYKKEYRRKKKMADDNQD